MKNDVSGMKFGRLTAIKPTELRKHGNVVWDCACECGKTKQATLHDLNAGTVKSCGCMQTESRYNREHHVDLTGMKFGRLTVIKKAYVIKYPKNMTAFWECKCECGNIVIIAGQSLKTNSDGFSTKSCGCLQKDRLNKENYSSGGYVDGTCINLINNKTLTKANKSGTRGVSYDKARKKWMARIKFKGKEYHLGRYTNKEDAISARKKAEEKMFDEFLEWWDINYNSKGITP